MQVKHPDHSYRGMSDMKKCPSFIADYDCLAHYIEPKYHQLGQKVLVLFLGFLPLKEVDDTMGDPAARGYRECAQQSLQLPLTRPAPCPQSAATRAHGLLL